MGRWSRQTASITLAALLVHTHFGLCSARAAEQTVGLPPVAHLTLLSPPTIAVSGRHRVFVRVRVSEAAGDRALAATLVHAEITSGDATFDGTSRAVDGTTDSNGIVALPIMPGTIAGPVVLHLSLGAQRQDIDISLIRVPERPLVVGFATAGMGPVPGLIESPDNGPNGTLARRGTVSLYGTGAVARNTRATFAYNSADTLEQGTATGPFVDNPDDRPFPTYGDTSTRSADALSRNHLFARVENGGSSAMWGEFYAQGGAPDTAGGYNILVNGGRLALAGTRAEAGAFSARNDVAFDRVVLSPTGLGIADRALQPDIVVGSDVVTLVALDRRTGAVAAQRLLGRGTDYVLDYTSGLLRFINVLLPYDDALNPQVVVVQYQYGGPAVHAGIFGANGSLRLSRVAGDAPRLESWYLNDATGSGNLSIFGQALHGGSRAAAWTISHEHSAGIAPVSTPQYGAAGDQYRAAFAADGGPLTFDLQFDASDAGYANPYGAFASPGLLSMNVDVRQRLSRIARLEFAYLTAKNDLPASTLGPAVSNADTHGRLALRVTPSTRLSYHLGLIDEAANGNGVVTPVTSFGGNAPIGTPGDPLTLPVNTSTIAYTPGEGHGVLLDSGIAWMFAKQATLSVEQRTPLSATTDPYDPPGTDVTLELPTGPNGKAFVRQSWQRQSSDVLAATQQGTAFTGTAQSTTTAGFEQQLGTTTVETDLAVERTASGTDLNEAIGARRTISLGTRLTGDAFAQAGRAFQSTGLPAQAAASPNFLAFGTSLTYSEKTFSATGQVQVRTGFNGGSTVVLGAAGPISPSVALFGSASESYTQDVSASTVHAGLSYRPANNDRAVTLVSVDSETGNVTNYDAYVTNVAQLQELYRPSRRTELAASFAYKITGDTTFAPRTTIYGVRADQRIGPRFDLGVELHRSGTAPIDGSQATGIAIEGGYRLGDQLRLAGGYNFSGFADPAAAVSPTHHGLYLTLSTYIDNILGWGKNGTHQ